MTVRFRQGECRLRGFTLIEMLLVMVILSMVVTLLVVAVGDSPGRELLREAKRLEALMNMAADDALMQGQELYLELSVGRGDSGSGYQFKRWDADQKQWIAFEPGNAIPLAAEASAVQKEGSQDSFYELPDTMSVEIETSGSSVSSAGTAFTDTQLKVGVLFLSSGEITPFQLRLFHPEVAIPEILNSDGFSGVQRLVEQGR